MTEIRYSIEQAADLVKADLESKGCEIQEIFAHTKGFTITIKEADPDE